MIPIIDILDRLPFELAARLESDPFFCDIPVVVAVKGNLARQLQLKEAAILSKQNKRGVAVFVLQIAADDIWDGIPGSPMKLYPAFQIIENVELNNDENGTKKSARKIARQIVKNMKIAAFRGYIQALKPAKPAIEPVVLKDFPDEMVGEQVNFECMEFSDEPFFYCLPPVVAGVAGSNPPQVAITTATPGGQIWFTTDDSFPYAGDKDVFPESTSQLYCGPITVQMQPPTVIRAMVVREGFIGSSIERFTASVTSVPI